MKKTTQIIPLEKAWNSEFEKEHFSRQKGYSHYEKFLENHPRRIYGIVGRYVSSLEANWISKVDSEIANFDKMIDGLR